MRTICLPHPTKPPLPGPTLGLTREQDAVFRDGIECAAAAAGLTVETWCYQVILKYVDLDGPQARRGR